MSFNWASLTDPTAPAELSATGAGASVSTSAGTTFRGRYDNAETTHENKRLWWGVDALSAKAANSFAVRRTLRMRSRHELANNPYLFGICDSNADDLVDTGPTLQVQTSSATYNRLVEQLWADWCAEVGFTSAIRTAKLAKTVDGEGFLALKTVDDLEHPIKLFPVDVEADQVTTPAPQNVGELWVDGLVLHKVTGRPTHYHILTQHPGDYFFPEFGYKAERVPAQWVVHWFRKFRPGQVRGVPVFTPALDLFHELRAYRRAVLGAAQIAASFAAVIESEDPANTVDSDDEEDVDAFQRVPIEHGAMVQLPWGKKLHQFDAKQPTTSYEQFHEKCLGEACRPLRYPLNLALGTSQKFNFSSAKLDHISYRDALRVEREDCNVTVLEKVFALWFLEGLLAGVIPAFDGRRLPPREWQWPGFQALDPQVDASADHERLANGSDTWRDFWARRGRDWREVMAQQAEERAEIERLGLEFGDPAQRTVSETIDQEPANVA